VRAQRREGARRKRGAEAVGDRRGRRQRLDAAAREASRRIVGVRRLGDDVRIDLEPEPRSGKDA
jgi:hypothetical protein